MCVMRLLCFHFLHQVAKRSEVELPNGYCGFEFALTANELTRLLADRPLFVSVMHKDKYTGHRYVCCVEKP